MAVDLKRRSGLPLKLEEHRLVFGAGMKRAEPDARTRKRMLSVLKNPRAKAPKEFYYMYRGVAREKDRKKINRNNLRYDITILPPFKAGDEFNRTFGHFHPKVPGTKTWWPEIYEVLHGRANYLLQNGKEFLVYDARPGDKCVMLPGFAHATVNTSSSETLVMANWVFPGFRSNYSPIQKKGGMQWFETEHGFVENKKYKSHDEIEIISPKEFPKFGITEKPMYIEAMKNPKKFAWLVRPQKYRKEFEMYRER